MVYAGVIDVDKAKDADIRATPATAIFPFRTRQEP